MTLVAEYMLVYESVFQPQYCFFSFNIIINTKCDDTNDDVTMMLAEVQKKKSVLKYAQSTRLHFLSKNTVKTILLRNIITI